ncbi:Gfo/Idh/MocA family oxidoreductase [Akkermansiaceae bacterium]|nr:Gfo/Idh/MocA family oxidoreductase [Akkermansiaceae bacterium]
MSKTIRVLCVGAGHMGRSHALAYHQIEGFEICGIVTRSPESRGALNEELGGGYAEFGDFYEALKETKPDAVSISTYPNTHAEFALAAFEAGADVY